MEDERYRPATRVLDQLRQVEFVAVVGPTGAGKTTLIKAAVAAHPKLHMLVAVVSREPRPEERDGVDFHFVDKPAMKKRVEGRDYATVVTGVSGDLYATAPEDYPAGKVTLLATLAEALPMFRALPYRSFRTIFIVPPSWEVWQKRLEGHAFTPEQLARRLTEAKRSLRFALDDAETHFVINNTIDVAIEDFSTLALGKPLSARLQADQSRARELVQKLRVKL